MVKLHKKTKTNADSTPDWLPVSILTGDYIALFVMQFHMTAISGKIWKRKEISGNKHKK